jgi:hypothetical protein
VLKVSALQWMDLVSSEAKMQAQAADGGFDGPKDFLKALNAFHAVTERDVVDRLGAVW